MAPKCNHHLANVYSVSAPEAILHTHRVLLSLYLCECYSVFKVWQNVAKPTSYPQMNHEAHRNKTGQSCEEKKYRE